MSFMNKLCLCCCMWSYVVLCCAQGVEKEAFVRYNLAPDPMKMVSFTPVRLTDSQIAETTSKRASLGAMLLGHFGSLPTTSAAVLWDVELSLEPPARVKPLKPKLWLMGRLQMQAGVYYLLE